MNRFSLLAASALMAWPLTASKPCQSGPVPESGAPRMAAIAPAAPASPAPASPSAEDNFDSMLQDRGQTETVAPNTVSPSPPQQKIPRAPTSLFEEEKLSAAQMANLTVRINVPQKTRVVDAFIAYPWPVRPPKCEEPEDLPTKRKELRGLLLSSGYANRTSLTRPYPNGGWRWQYCFRKAVAQSGISVPHTILTMYGWADEMGPKVAKECRIRNDFEKARWQKYLKFVEEYERNYNDLENDAVRAGLSPIAMRPKGPMWTKGALPEGNWWITATHKVPGLTYYWQIPITAAAGENVNLLLNEANAMVITGGW